MARPLRIQFEDAYYHVMNRGRGRQIIFLDEEYYQDYLLGLEEAHKRFGIEVHAYCLMGNHYHLLVKTPRANLSRAMRHIDGLYTQRHNRRKRTDGPLFRGRYKAIVIDASSYLLQVSRYIHRNPIEMKKPLVDNLKDYPWSSYVAYINKGNAYDWLNRDSVFGELGSRQKYRAYQNYVEQEIETEVDQFYIRKNLPAILGDDDFKKHAHQQALSLTEEIDKKGLKEPVRLNKIIQVVARFHGLSEDAILVAKRGQGVQNIPRWIAMKLCQELGGAKLTEMAGVFGVNHYSTISQTIGRLNRLMAEDEKVKNIFNILSQDLTP